MDNVRKQIQKLSISHDGSHKKVLLSVLGTASLLKDGEELVDKLERNLDVYEGNKDKILLVFCVQKGIEEKLKFIRQDLIKPYHEIVQMYMNSDNCVVVNFDDLDDIYDICDAYYGDWSIAAWTMNKLEKPVMILDASVE
ncbi:hypothetical protein [Butyrivibrio sp. AE3004]|uniref:hypothetical protein n=1 Tax=Butyrivibrio sp. AE3004 TaxID=1506994 RepID=UPI000494CC60|nr:hypothetical protein [Butyrivibrio sp. AE3004]